MLFLRYLNTGISSRAIDREPVIFAKVSPPGNYEHCSALTFFFYLMSFSTGNTIQTHSFYFLFPSIFVDMFENKSKSVNILIC